MFKGEIGSCSWEINDSGLLTISPTNGISGRMDEGCIFNDPLNPDNNYMPWSETQEMRESIKSVFVEKGVEAYMCQRLFQNLPNCREIDAKNLEVAQDDLSTLCMFADCKSLEKVELPDFFANRAQMEEVGAMFFECEKLKEVDLSKVDFSHVRGMGAMFEGCKNLEFVDLSMADLSKLENLYAFCYDCKSLKSIDFGENDLQKVKDVEFMLTNCSQLEFFNIQINSLNPTLYNRELLLDDCPDVKHLNKMNEKLQRPDPDAYGRHGQCCWELSKDGALEIFPMSENKNMLADQRDLSWTSPWEKHKDRIESVTIADGVKGNADMSFTFYNLRECESIDISKLDTSNVERMDSMFENCSKLESIDMRGLDTSKIMDVSYMVKGCESLQSLNLESFDLTRISGVKEVFENCHSLEDLTLRTDNAHMFDKHGKEVASSAPDIKDILNKTSKAQEKGKEMWKPQKETTKNFTNPDDFSTRG